ncbi:VRR-NUC domain containing protein [Synechococcus phage Ssp-JY38]|nr:nuclease [Synechococcus phage Yong-L2-223]
MALTPDQIVGKSKTEHSIQTAFFAWVAIVKHAEARWLHAIPSGGERNAIVAGRMKAEGVRKGIWDVSLPVAKGGYHGLYIEFKRPEHRNRKNGGLTDEQVEFGAHCHAQGYRMRVCYTWREAAATLCEYLGVPLTHAEPPAESVDEG